MAMLAAENSLPYMQERRPCWLNRICTIYLMAVS